jgi:hypothetical protein
MKFNIKNLILEGPDCSGKSTAYREIHKITKFKWNIQDRSTLSMLSYAILYGRETDDWDRLLYEELSDLNNVIVILLPPLQTILERLEERGDEFQNIDSITKLYEIFDRLATLLEEFPNVFVCKGSTVGYEHIVNIVTDYSNMSYDHISSAVERHADASPGKETINLRFAWSDNDFKTHDITHLQHPSEVSYYNVLCERFTTKIRDELLGKNEYGLKQTSRSRRFVISQDTCISFVQALVRNEELMIKVVCRSSEVSTVFKHDIHLIAQLGRIAAAEINTHINNTHFDVTLCSAHIIRPR